MGDEEEPEEPIGAQFTEKYLFLPYFKSKLYHKVELKELNEVDGTFSLLKTAMIYKQMTFDEIFAQEYMVVHE